VFTQTDINQIFSASHNFCGGVGGLGFSQLGSGLGAIFVATAV